MASGGRGSQISQIKIKNENWKRNNLASATAGWWRNDDVEPFLNNSFPVYIFWMAFCFSYLSFWYRGVLHSIPFQFTSLLFLSILIQLFNMSLKVLALFFLIYFNILSFLLLLIFFFLFVYFLNNPIGLSTNRILIAFFSITCSIKE